MSFIRPACDVSENNGEPEWLPINWGRVVASKEVELVMARACLGTSRPDHAFAVKWAALRRTPLIQAAYCYCIPGMAPTLLADARAHAHYLWQMVMLQGGPHKDDLPPMLDVEITNGLAATQLQEWTDASLTELQSLSGRIPILYSNEWFLGYYLGPLLKKWPILVSAYQLKEPTLEPRVGWQYENNGYIPGIQTPVDRDWWSGPWPGTVEWQSTFVKKGGV